MKYDHSALTRNIRHDDLVLACLRMMWRKRAPFRGQRYKGIRIPPWDRAPFRTDDGETNVIFLDADRGACENHDGAGPLHDGEAVLEDNVAGQHGAKLSCGHDAGIKQGAKGLNGDGGEQSYEANGLPQAASEREGDDGHAGGREVDVEHLVVHGHVILFEQILLVRGGDGVKQQVAEHEHKAERGVGVCGGGVVCRHIAGGDHGGAAGQHDGHDGKVLVGVLAARPELENEHDGQHLGALSNGDGRKGQPLERLVLARGGNDVGHGDGEVVGERGGGAEVRRLAAHDDEHDGEHGGQHAVGQHQEERVREEGGGGGGGRRVGARHDALLQQRVDHEAHHDAQRARGGVRDGGRRRARRAALGERRRLRQVGGVGLGVGRVGGGARRVGRVGRRQAAVVAARQLRGGAARRRAAARRGGGGGGGRAAAAAAAAGGGRGRGGRGACARRRRRMARARAGGGWREGGRWCGAVGGGVGVWWAR
ncbi:Adenosine 3'-phospho 5'-phosphosulfate transporter PAPST [Gracilaria domingensis]|nr:Adenosine 3'-phospho 5'-phosphosulfate transporter PAPST [Gracilaria domingensis]